MEMKWFGVWNVVEYGRENIGAGLTSSGYILLKLTLKMPQETKCGFNLKNI
jgi:hypothetical protein